MVFGIDGAKSSWVAIRLERGSFAGCILVPTLSELLDDHPDAAVFAIDVPIGLPDAGRRPADRDAREFVGARRSSVFDVPPRAVLQAGSYGQA